MLEFPVIGRWNSGEIGVSWTQNTRPIVPEVEQLIETAWKRAMSRPGVHLFDGPMCRLEAVDARSDQMHLTLSRTSYKPFVGTNMSNPQLADAHGRAVLANPVGLSTVLLTSDGSLLLGRRNANVAYYPSHVHPFAGCLEPADNLDVFADVRRELREELAIRAEDIVELACAGIAEDRALRQPEIIFAAQTTRTASQIDAQLDLEEHLGIFRIDATAGAVEAALQSGEAFTPVGIASMLLWGRIEFGDAWFNAVSAKYRAN